MERALRDRRAQLVKPTVRTARGAAGVYRAAQGKRCGTPVARLDSKQATEQRQSGHGQSQCRADTVMSRGRSGLCRSCYFSAPKGVGPTGRRGVPALAEQRLPRLRSTISASREVKPGAAAPIPCAPLVRKRVDNLQS
jgi:hypothetical protein